MIAADKHCHNSSIQHRTMLTPTEGRPENLTVLRCIEFEVLVAVTIELPGASWVQLLNLLFAHTVLTTAGPICCTYYWGLHFCYMYQQGLQCKIPCIFVTGIIRAYIFVAHLVLLGPICIFVPYIVFLEPTYSLHPDRQYCSIGDQLRCACLVY